MHSFHKLTKFLDDLFYHTYFFYANRLQIFWKIWDSAGREKDGLDKSISKFGLYLF